MSAEEILNRLGIQPLNSGACGAGWLETPGGGELRSLNPATGAPIASVAMASAADYDTVMDDAAAVLSVGACCPPPNAAKSFA